VNTNVTLVERGSLVQDELAASWYGGALGWNRNLDAAWSNVALGRQGARLPKHPVIMPLLSTPLFWAFGLDGTLLFNLLGFAVMAAGLFAFARRYASDGAAAAAVLAATLGSALRMHVYDYHVDVLNLALFGGALGLLSHRRGFWAGVLLGGCVVIKPTGLLWLPFLAAILLADGRRGTLWRGLAGGALVLLLFAAFNTWLFGRPWWTGYNRTLVVVDGVPRVADHVDAFGVPLREGLRTLWSGPWGVRSRLALFAFAAPGLLALLRRRSTYALAATLAALTSVLVFAKYLYYGDRFLWPSAALLVPALAASFDLGARWIRGVPPAAWVGGLATLALLLTDAATGGSAAFLADPGLQALRIASLSLAGGALASAARPRALGPAAPVAWLLVPQVLEALRDPLVGLGASAALLAIGIVGATRLRAGLAAVLLVLGGLLLPAGLGPSPSRLLLAVALALAPWSAAPVLGRALLLAAFALLAAGLGRHAFALGAAAFALAAPSGASRLGGWLAAVVPPRAPALVLAAAAILFAFGAARRLGPTEFRLASQAAVRDADVYLGEVPCDFLAWEHFNWECATFDRGVHDEVGLSTSQPLHVGGLEERLFLLSASTRPRRVEWRGIPRRGARQLHLRWAVPDELPGARTLVARVGEAEREVPLAGRGRGRFEHLRLDLGDAETFDLTLELRGRGAVLLDGELVP
jgi:hypothetical protein